jgi:uncharacterized protein YdgA (DUF945 family)
MKKAAIAAAVVVLVGGSYVGATAYTSNKIAEAYEARIAKLEQQYPFVHIVDRQARKGLFSTTYSGSVRIGCAAPAAGDGKEGKALLVGFKDHVRAGPLPGFDGFGAATIDSQIILPPEVPEAVRKYFAGMKPEDIRTRVNYVGDFRTTVRLPAGDFALPEGKLRWPEIHATSAGKLDGSSLGLDARVPEIEFVGTPKDDGVKGTQVKLVNLNWHGTSTAGNGVWLRPGESTIEIERAEVETRIGIRPFSAQVGKIKHRTELHADKDMLDSKVTLSADATLRFGGDDAKPVQLDNIELQESVRQLHGPTLQKALDSAMAHLSACDAKPLSETDAMERGFDMLHAFAELLPYSPEMSVDKLAVTFDGQRGELSYSVSAPGFTKEDLESPMSIQAKLQTSMVFKASGKLPVSWIEAYGARAGDEETAPRRIVQLKSMVEFVVGQGYAVREGEFLTSSAVIDKGAVTLNGKPIGGR